ncbi:hypothetical protein, partial [Streptococcus suis]
FDYNRKKKWKLKALAATSIAGGFLVFLYEKNWLEAIIKQSDWNIPVAFVYLYSSAIKSPENLIRCHLSM